MTFTSAGSKHNIMFFHNELKRSVQYFEAFCVTFLENSDMPCIWNCSGRLWWNMRISWARKISVNNFLSTSNHSHILLDILYNFNTIVDRNILQQSHTLNVHRLDAIETKQISGIP